MAELDSGARNAIFLFLSAELFTDGRPLSRESSGEKATISRDREKPDPAGRHIFTLRLSIETPPATCDTLAWLLFGKFPTSFLLFPLALFFAL